MKRTLLLVTSLAVAVALSACSKEDTATKSGADQTTAKTKTDNANSEAIGELSVPDLAGLLENKDDLKVAVFDSNSPGTRKKYGKIPGATLLSDYQEFDKSELPENKDCTLVFYCSNTHCGASHSSAKVAMAAGYSDVNVLPAGIMGWSEAGQKTEAVQ